MPTALTIIKDAFLEIGVLASGEPLPPSMSADALRSLNRIMGILSNNRSFAFYRSTVSRALTGEASFTIGPAGDVTDPRPLKIETAIATKDGITYPVAVADNEQWDDLVQKTDEGDTTEIVYYEPTAPEGTVYVWPQSTCTLDLRVMSLVGSFSKVTTDLDLPEGYEFALVKMLAVDLYPQYPAGSLSALTERAAKNALRMVKRTNTVIPTLSLDSSLIEPDSYEYTP